MRFLVRVVYHQMPDKAMRAINFFSRRPTLLGRPLIPSVVIMLDREDLMRHRGEIEPLIKSKVIEVVGEDGSVFTYPEDRSLTPEIAPEEALRRAAQEDLLRELREAPLPPIQDDSFELPPDLSDDLDDQRHDRNEEFFSKLKKEVSRRYRKTGSR